MYSGSHSTRDQRDQEFAPLLFSLSVADGAALTTPRTATPGLRRDDSSMSTRRSAATPTGSVHTETTPPTPPPPVLRLMDDVIMGERKGFKNGHDVLHGYDLWSER